MPRLRPRFLQVKARMRARRKQAAMERERGGSSSGDGDTFGMAADGCLDVFGEWALVVVAVVVVLAVAWFFVVPLLLLLVDAVVLVLVATVAIAAKVLLRRPWRIEVARGDDVVGSVSVVGLGNARSRRDEIVASLAAGIDPATLVDHPART